MGFSWVCLTAALLSTAHARRDDSVVPAIEQLVAKVTELEQGNVQIIGLQIVRMAPGVTHLSVPMEVQVGGAAIYAVLDDRSSDGLEVSVRTPSGLDLAGDDSGERAFAIEFEAKLPGPYAVDLDRVRLAQDKDQGVQAILIHGVPTDRNVITALPVLDMVNSVAQYAEDDLEHHFVGLSMNALFDKEPDVMTVLVPQDTYEDCLAVVSGTPERTRKIRMSVGDANGETFAGSDRIGAAMRLSRFINDERDPRHLFAVQAKTRHRLGDTHIALFVACREP